jgi:putative restriction endonuclease
MSAAHYYLAMTGDRLRSIVPMFGGATNYVQTLEAILEFVDTHQPTTDELVGWHRGTFAAVSSRDSIMRRVSYLEQAGFLTEPNVSWHLGDAGRAYIDSQDTETLYRLMCERNVGLRSLLYALLAGPMTITEISDQQLDTHPDLGWSRGETDMALQRVNWLRSMGLLAKRDGAYELTNEGQDLVEKSVAQWTETDWTPAADDPTMMTAGTYETVTHARAVDPEFRATVLARHEHTCPVSGVDHPGLLDVAHVLSWSDYPEYRADLGNVLALSKTHHAAFDRELFTLDQEYRLRVNPDFETDSELLTQTIVDCAGERVAIPEDDLDPAYLREHNAALAWV